jgi:5-(carboxyamino)imidazole ribonucleotide mutase
MATGDEILMQKLVAYKQKLKQKIVQANKELSRMKINQKNIKVKYNFKTN